MRAVLVTNVTQYAGPGIVEALLRQGAHVICHDASFNDPTARDGFCKDRTELECLSGSTPETLAQELKNRAIDLDAVVSNDTYPNTPMPIGDIDPENFRSTFEAVFMFPVQLAQLLLLRMKQRKSGSFVFITSARQLRPELGFAVATSVRAATTTFALAMAREAAPFGIQVNTVAPNYLHSELYYPRERFIDDPEGRRQIASLVPIGRLGTQEEIGELVAFLTSGRSTFVTGQVIYFTGGWP